MIRIPSAEKRCEAGLCNREQFRDALKAFGPEDKKVRRWKRRNDGYAWENDEDEDVEDEVDAMDY